MKEIKFRIRLGDVWHYWGFLKGHSDYIFAGIPSSSMDLISMREAMERSQQYIGGKDADGVEIYAGDIIECLEDKQGSVHKGERGKVVYVEYGFCAESLPPDDWDVMAPSFQINVGPVKVIGNEHENPELLKKSLT